MCRILITGGAGFIGSSLAERLLRDDDYFVVVADILVTGNTKFICDHPRYRFVHCDVNDYRDISRVMKEYQFNYVFHYAALVGVQRTLANPKEVLRDIHSLQNIFSLCLDTGVTRIYISSSSEVYGETISFPQHEYNTPLNSRLPYAVVKNLGECFCRSFWQENGLEYTIFRFFNTYGYRQRPEFVIAKFIKAALMNEPLTIYGDGKQTRTFCYIGDNLDFTARVLKEALFVNDVVNVGNDAIVNINHVAQTIIALTGSKSGCKYLPPLAEGDMKLRQPDVTRMRAVLNRSLITFEEGITEVLNQHEQVVY
jgi:nucleoside-diphosphate-sugar epimerase